MRTRFQTVIFAAAAGLAVWLACAQVGAARPARAAAAPQQSAPTATTNPNEGFLRTWKDITRKILVMAEDFPEDKYDYKPKPEVRTFAESVLHVTSSVYYFQAMLEGKSPSEEDPKRANFKNKAEIVAYAKKAFADGTALLEKADFSKTIQGPRRAINPYAFWSDFCEHPGEHYGQMVVYYRLNGIVPPESRPKK
ncbi:MAG TPA: DinB family protein [Candidatus Acidoferrales bacterium]|nr:DinB family protein [Candidatus Acidoferrales bacterium]